MLCSQQAAVAPTRALATLGVCLDDDELVQLLELVEAMGERPTRVRATT
jgi:hypothetical protein